MLPQFSRRRFLWLLPLAALPVTAAGFGLHMMEPPPSNLDVSLSKKTEHGLYLATVMSNSLPVPVGTIHSWTIKVTTPDKKPADGVTIAIEGGMPQHGHGLPTQPRVTTDLGNGSHTIEGMKFSMTGWWTLTVTINSATGSDKATFNLVL